jgi:hypothetical protein
MKRFKSHDGCFEFENGAFVWYEDAIAFAKRVLELAEQKTAKGEMFSTDGIIELALKESEK